MKIIAPQNTYQVHIENIAGILNCQVNDLKIKPDIIKISENEYHVLIDHKSYNIYVLAINSAENTVELKVNGEYYKLQAENEFAELLKKMGMQQAPSKNTNLMKAPMPGLVSSVFAKAGTEVKKGDPLFILEAMKMENVLKSPLDGTITKVHVVKGVSVEKNELLLEFE